MLYIWGRILSLKKLKKISSGEKSNQSSAEVENLLSDYVDNRNATLLI